MVDLFDGKDNPLAMIDVVLVQEHKIGTSEEADEKSQWLAKRGWKSVFSLAKISKEKKNHGVCVVGGQESCRVGEPTALPCPAPPPQTNSSDAEQNLGAK